VALAPSGPGSIDVIEIDAASHGGVDDARDLRERAFYAPVSGRFKIYIIDEAHMVTREGFNALLKLVEEPPPHLKFVFATTEPEKVISTIRSRTHHYPFRLVPPAVLRELLEEILASEKVSYEPAVLPVVIRAGAGSVRDSLSVLDQLIAGSDESGLRYDRAVALLGYTDDALIDEVTSAFAAGDGAAVFRAIDKVVEGGHDPRRFAADLLDRLRDLIVFAAVPDAAATGLLDVPPDRLARMSEQAAELGQAQLVSAAETISAGLVEMRGATSPRLQLELMCAQVLLPAPGSRERDLLARLERLEHRLASGGVAIPPATAPAPSGPAGAAAAPAAPDTPPGPDTAGPSERGAAAARAAVADAARTRAAPGPARGAPGPDGEPDPAGRRSGAPQAAPADSRPDAPSAPAAVSAPAATRGGSGPVTAAMIRDRWADVLAAVRQQRKVAWILLSNAAVGDLTENVLTLNFGQAGEARGFSASGYDGDLAGVLQALFGISPQICAIFGAPPGQAGTGPRPPRGTGQDDPGPGPGGPEADARPAERPGPGSPGSGRAGGTRGDDADEAGPSRSGSGPAGPGGSRPGPGQGPGAAGSGPPGARRPGRRDGAAGPEPADPGTPAGPAGPAATRAAARAAARPAGRAAAGRPTAGGAAPDWVPQPDDEVEDSDSDALSGTDLIARELGGQVIEEFGET